MSSLDLSVAKFSEGFNSAFAQIAAVSDPDQILSLMHTYLKGVGFHDFNYGFFDTSGAPLVNAPVAFTSTMAPDWIDYYGNHRLDLIDDIANHVRGGSLKPIFAGNGLRHFIEAPTQPVKEIYDMAQEVGFVSAIGMRLPAPSDNRELVSGICLVSSLKGKRFLENWGQHSTEVLLLINLVQQRIGGFLGGRAKNDGLMLSARERDCLLYLAAGHRVVRIAEKLSLAEVTVHTHLRAARKKLGAQTLPQAIALAISAGELAP